MALLELKDLSIAFGSLEVLGRVSWKLEKSGNLGLVGESGSGKSLTALALMGLLPHGARASGSLKFDGQELLGADESFLRSQRGGSVAMVFQEPFNCLNPVMKVGEQIAEAVCLHRGMDKPAGLREAVQWLGRSGIADPEVRAAQYPHQFSGGMRQRAMIAMAMACRPKLLIADEPTTALDVTVQAQILKLIQEMTAEFGVALLMISHDLGVIHAMAEHIVVMKKGEIMEQGSRDQIFGAPQNAYTRELMQSYLSWAGAA